MLGCVEVLTSTSQGELCMRGATRGSWNRWLWAILIWSLPAWAEDYKRTQSDGGPDSPKVCLTWNKRIYVYRVDQRGLSAKGVDVSDAITHAFAEWQMAANTCSDFKFEKGEPVSRFKTGNVKGSESANVLTFREKLCQDIPECRDPKTCMNDFECWGKGEEQSKDVVAIARVTHDLKTGEISDADIEFNAAHRIWTTADPSDCAGGEQPGKCVQYDIQNTLTHEIGHAMGLDHVGREDSTMYKATNPGDIFMRTLDEGTIRGFCQMYPRGLPPASCDAHSLDRLGTKAQSLGTPGFQSVGCSTDAQLPALFEIGVLLHFLARNFRKKKSSKTP